jgi:hypothetical protein
MKSGTLLRSVITMFVFAALAITARLGAQDAQNHNHQKDTRYSINNYGQVVGQAFDQKTGTLPGFIATPNNEDRNSQSEIQARRLIQLPATIRDRLQQRRGLSSGRLRKRYCVELHWAQSEL